MVTDRYKVVTNIATSGQAKYVLIDTYTGRTMGRSRVFGRIWAHKMRGERIQRARDAAYSAAA